MIYIRIFFLKSWDDVDLPGVQEKQLNFHCMLRSSTEIGWQDVSAPLPPQFRRGFWICSFSFSFHTHFCECKTRAQASCADAIQTLYLCCPIGNHKILKPKYIQYVSKISRISICLLFKWRITDVRCITAFLFTYIWLCLMNALFLPWSSPHTQPQTRPLALSHDGFWRQTENCTISSRYIPKHPLIDDHWFILLIVSDSFLLLWKWEANTFT